MSRRRRQQAEGERSSSGTRRIVAVLVLVLTIVVLLVKTPSMLAWRARHSAKCDIEAGALTSAQQWLEWAESCQPDNSKTSLLLAACFRRFDDRKQWLEAIQQAELRSAPQAQLEQERALGVLQWDPPNDDAEGTAVQLLATGVSPDGAMTSLITGLLMHGYPDRARQALGAWAADFPGGVQVDFMSGVLCQWAGDETQAETYFRSVLLRQPRHERARIALAEMVEGQERLEEALELYVDGTRLAPNSAAFVVGAARMLRCTGRNAQARAVLSSLPTRDPLPAGFAVEMAQVEFEDGHFEEAVHWFERADLEGAHFTETLRAAASSFMFVGDLDRAEQLFSRIDVVRNRSLRLVDLQTRLAVNPADQASATELQRLSTTANAGELDPRRLEDARSGDDHAQDTEAMRLYQVHCSACHGRNGNGQGPAARHLFPRPRDFRREPTRLVSTLNAVPTLEDLEAVIRRGMPGTAMRAFEDLSDAERKLLAKQVVRFIGDGIREQIVELMRAEDEEVDEDEVRQLIEMGTTPGDPAPIPPFETADPAAISRGAETYASLGCAKCHGEDGTGSSSEPLFDDRDRPIAARDLVHESMRGGSDFGSIYLRVRLGMPGTPHPSCLNVSEEELVDLVHYCRSLAREPAQDRTGFEQFLRASGYNHSP